MNISRDEAHQALDGIDRATDHARRRLILAPVGPFLVLWGIVAAAAYLLTWWLVTRQQFDAIWAAWGGMITAGWVGHWLMSRRYPIRNTGDWKLRALWGLLALYAALWLMIFHPWDGIQVNLFLVTLSMFAYTAIGLYEWRFMLWLGLGVTALIVGGYLLITPLNPLFWLYMAMITGGALMLTGVALIRQGRR